MRERQRTPLFVSDPTLPRFRRSIAKPNRSYGGEREAKQLRLMTSMPLCGLRALIAIAERVRVGSGADERLKNEGAPADTTVCKRPAFATISAKHSEAES